MSLVAVCAAAFGSAAGAAASNAPTPPKPKASDTLDRPGAGTHFPRGGFRFDNSGHPVTGQGPNKGTKSLEDTLEAAGAPRR
ncbi:PEBP family protein [Segniliparus rotundus DSM 44985]|uniref:PEBP family protein n=1 Tax=Segniliparus rotundus (strain ATCC BAA-972 / CDC 1076 / CIP 108378 / DSM 44985 / JCM 13578) TaxID=640132 RepID=D6ZAD6_SEGRD|nr:hypothetical protein [Segniliparus rotundus]ADG96678.1 PEBP family protein [Segniliparus rotundus DSM 44985]